jgi:hypothetical protein
MPKDKKDFSKQAPNESIPVRMSADENLRVATAHAFLSPDTRHAVAVMQVLKPHFGKVEGAPGIGDYAEAIRARGDSATKGQLAFVSNSLAAQAVTLDTIFTEMARRMALNMGDYLGATETYARIALRAQAQSRATLETLAKLHQPREQTVRHVHVNEGGQAVIADQFHHHEGGSGENGKSVKQSDATGPSCGSAALPCPDALGNGMPVPSRQRQAQMQDARRD